MFFLQEVGCQSPRYSSGRYFEVVSPKKLASGSCIYKRIRASLLRRDTWRPLHAEEGVIESQLVEQAGLSRRETQGMMGVEGHAMTSKAGCAPIVSSAVCL